MELDIAHLPPSAQRLIDIIGLPATLAVVEKHGGKTMRLFQTGEAIDRMTSAIGAELAGKLLDHFGSDPFIVPRCKLALDDVRNARIHNEFDRLTQAEHRSSRDSVHRIVEQFQLSERQVWRILKKSTGPSAAKSRPVDVRQMSLI